MIDGRMPEVPKQTTLPQAEIPKTEIAKPKIKAANTIGEILLDTPSLFALPSGEYDRNNGAPLDRYRTQMAINDVVGFGLSYFNDSAFTLSLRGSGARKLGIEATAPDYSNAHEDVYASWYNRIATLPESVMRGSVKADYAEALMELPADIRAPYEQILVGGSDLDIKISPNTHSNKPIQADLPDQFSKDVFAHFLPKFSRALADDSYRTHPASTMQRIASLTTATEASPELVNLPVELNNPDEGEYIAVINRGISALPIEANVSGEKFPNTVVFAKRMKVRDGKITVTQIVIGADRRTNTDMPLTSENINDNIQPIATMQFVSTLTSEEESRRYDSRISPAATSRDRLLANVALAQQPDNIPLDIGAKQIDTLNLRLRYKEMGQEEPAPQVIATLDEQQVAEFEKPITLGDDWGKDKEQPFRNPVDDMEIASRALWQAIQAGIYEPNMQTPRAYIEDTTLQKINRFIAEHAEIAKQLGQPEAAYQRGQIQQNLLLMMQFNPHQAIDLINRSGFGKLLFPNENISQLQEALSRIISEEDYRLQFFGSRVGSLEEASLSQVRPPILTAEDLLHADDRQIPQNISPSMKSVLAKELAHREEVARLPKRDGWTLLHGLLFPRNNQDKATTLHDLYNLTNIG